MAINFTLRPHGLKPGVWTTEVLLDGEMVAIIYPDEDRGIKIISAHIDGAHGVVEDDGTGDQPPIPHVSMRFDPRPYTITDGKLIREGDPEWKQR